MEILTYNVQFVGAVRTTVLSARIFGHLKWYL